MTATGKSEPIALLCRSTPHSRGLAAALCRQGLDLKLIVIEESPPSAPLVRLKAHVASLLGPARTRRLMDWRRPPSELEMAERGWKERALRWQLEAWPHSTYPEGVVCMRTSQLNGPETIAALHRHGIQLLVVFGTGKLQPSLYQAVPRGALNGHTSLLPRYRGNFPEFWQLYHNAYDAAGFTIHRIDRELDTGEVLYQEPVAAGPDDDPYGLHARCAIAMMKAFAEVVQAELEGRSVATPQEAGDGKVYRLRDVTEAHRWELYERWKEREPADPWAKR